jgi:hypothetical protein
MEMPLGGQRSNGISSEPQVLTVDIEKAMYTAV